MVQTKLKSQSRFTSEDEFQSNDELTDRLLELVAFARRSGHPMTVELLKMALLNEVGAVRRN